MGSATSKAPLIPLPVITVPFSRLAFDVVGPLPRTQSSYKYILTCMCYASKYPEAMLERWHASLKSMLKKAQGDCKDWDKYLKYLLLAYRSAPHSVTGFLQERCTRTLDASARTDRET